MKEKEMTLEWVIIGTLISGGIAFNLFVWKDIKSDLRGLKSISDQTCLLLTNRMTNLESKLQEYKIDNLEVEVTKLKEQLKQKP